MSATMSSLIQIVVVALIVAIVLFFTIRGIIRRARGRKPSCCE
jgi:uncharacterized membrane protein YqiK